MNNEKFETYFQTNLSDWFLGGPSITGWTRSGAMITPKYDVCLSRLSHVDMDVEEILGKNAVEVEKWHIQFISQQTSECPIQGIEESLYWKEYLMPRYNKSDAYKRVKTFIELFYGMKNNGYNNKFPVWVADVRSLKLGFRYFRFDGCHRVACAKTLGICTVPTCLFSIEIKKPVSWKTS